MDKLNNIESLDGIIVNNGEIKLNLNFDNFDTHADMCYEFTNCSVLEPDDNIEIEGLDGVLICREEQV